MIDVENLADQWIAEILSTSVPTESDGHDETAESASDIALHLAYRSTEAAWAFVERVLVKTTSTKVLGLLAAGILEELITLDDANSIPKLRGLVERHPVLAEVLNGVWQGDTSDATWQEVLRLRGA